MGENGDGAVAPVFQLYRVWGHDGVWWRLLNANGRGLARSASPHPTPAAARTDLEHLVSRADVLELGVRRTPDYRWHWSLQLAGLVVVEGIGEQDRRARCLAAGGRFQVLAPAAVVDPEVTTFRRAGIRSRMTPL